MQTSDFDTEALKFLEDLALKIETADKKFQLGIDFIDGVLNIELEDEKLYIINKHRPSQQIWLSSPVSGADYFSSTNGKWLNKNNLSITSVITTELKQLCNIDI